DFDERGLPRAHRTADAHPQRPPEVRRRADPAIWADNEGHERKSLVYCVSCHVDAKSTIRAADPRSSIVPASASAARARSACSTVAIASWPSVCPKGTSRTPAVTRLATYLFRNATSTNLAGMRCLAARMPKTTDRAG